MKTTVLLAGALLFLFSTQSKGQNSIKGSVGKKIHSVNNSVSSITQNVMGQVIDVKSDVSLTIDAEIMERSPEIILSIKIGRVQVKSEAMGNNTDFDSDKAEDKNGQVGQLLSSVIGKSFEIEMSVTGKLNKPIQPSDPANEAAKTLVGNFDELGGELVVAMPSSLSIGDSWVDELITDVDNKKKTEYSVISVNNTEATLSFKGTAVTKASKTFQDMDAVVTGSSNFNGELTVDIKSGVIKTKKNTVEVKGSTEIMGQSISFNSKHTTTTVNN